MTRFETRTCDRMVQAGPLIDSGRMRLALNRELTGGTGNDEVNRVGLV
jgi:hypothetical protein